MKYASKPNQQIWYVAPTFKMAKEICWSNLKEMLNQFNWIEDINETTLTIKIRKTNSTISLKGAENFDALRGSGLNFLILDEPTNDLDVITLNVLENFLLDYPGNLMVVSHDRYFMDKIVDALFVFRGDGIVENFPGNYSDFRAYENSNPYEQKEISNIKTEVKPAETKSQKVSLSYNEKREFGALEDEIQRLQNQKERIEKQFLNVEIAEENIAKKSEELKQTINNLEQKEERWLELSMKLES